MPDNKTTTTTTSTGTGTTASTGTAATTSTTTAATSSASAPSSVYAPDTTALKQMIFAGDPDLMMRLEKGERANKNRRSWYGPRLVKESVTFANTVSYIEPSVI